MRVASVEGLAFGFGGDDQSVLDRAGVEVPLDLRVHDLVAFLSSG